MTPVVALAAIAAVPVSVLLALVGARKGVLTVRIGRPPQPKPAPEAKP
jgi:hypothetical protein